MTKRSGTSPHQDSMTGAGYHGRVLMAPPAVWVGPTAEFSGTPRSAADLVAGIRLGIPGAVAAVRTTYGARVGAACLAVLERREPAVEEAAFDRALAVVGELADAAELGAYLEGVARHVAREATERATAANWNSRNERT